MTNNNKKAIIAILILGLIGLLYLNFYNVNKFARTENILLAEKTKLINDLSVMEIDFNTAIANNTTLTDELTIQRDNIIRFKDSLTKIKKSNWKLIRFYKKKIEDLNTSSKRILRKNDSLLRRNSELNYENQSLYEQKTVLDEQNKILNNANQDLSTKVAKQTVFNDTLIKQNLDLSKRVALAEIVKAGNFTVTTFRKRRNKYKESSRARRIDLFKTSFSLLENQVSKEKEITVHVAITTPDGSLLSPSGFFTMENGTEIKYSEMTVIPFKKSAINSDIVLEVEEELSRGTYQVDFYLDTKKVATVSKRLK